MHDEKHKVKAACAIRAQLMRMRCGELEALHQQLGPLTDTATRLDALHRKLRLAQQRGYDLAGHRLRGQLRWTLEQFQGLALPAMQTLNQAPLTVPPLRELVEALDQLREEFGDWRYEPRAGELTVSTEPIELEGLYLGTFEIRLQVFELDRRSGEAFRVVALDPHPARGSTDVTHPHVRDERPCLGEAVPAIRQALRRGQLCECFLLVRAVLETYNPDSPYVSLDDWEGVPCYECGELAREEEHFFCDGCERDFCEECIGSCRGCETSLCLGCLGRCEVCEEPVCDECVQRCGGCRRVCCGDCLSDELCPECQDEQEEIDDESQDQAKEQAEGHATSQQIQSIEAGAVCAPEQLRHHHHHVA